MCGELRNWQVTEIKEYGVTLALISYKENIIFMYPIQLLLCECACARARARVCGKVKGAAASKDTHEYVTTLTRLNTAG